MTGFHAKRSEFDHEFDNDAELLIAELEFLPTDTPVRALCSPSSASIKAVLCHILLQT